MNEIKLTHEQAQWLRIGALYSHTLESNFNFDLEDSGLLRRHSYNSIAITPAGISALAAYDAEWVMVRQSDLREVLDLLNTFFGFPEDSGGGRLMAALEAKC